MPHTNIKEPKESEREAAAEQETERKSDTSLTICCINFLCIILLDFDLLLAITSIALLNNFIEQSARAQEVNSTRKHTNNQYSTLKYALIKYACRWAAFWHLNQQNREKKNRKN